MLSSLSSFIIFAQTEQAKSTQAFSFLDLRTDNHASLSKEFSTRWMSTISPSLTVSDILPTGKLSVGFTYSQGSFCLFRWNWAYRMEVNEDTIDHRSYTHNLSSCEIKAEKIQTWTGNFKTG